MPVVAVIIAAAGGLVACRSDGSQSEPNSPAAPPPTANPLTNAQSCHRQGRRPDRLPRAVPRWSTRRAGFSGRAQGNSRAGRDAAPFEHDGKGHRQAARQRPDDLRVPHPAPYDVQIRGDRAVLHDCQDGTNGGHADHRTGKRLTHGMPGTHMLAAFAKEEDGVWRVAKVDQVDEPCSPAP